MTTLQSLDAGVLMPAPDHDCRRFRVAGETGRLTDVLLCPPSYLQPVPCCSVTREILRSGFSTSTTRALTQHRALRDALTGHGVACHMVPPRADLPDLCFTRDVAVTTPWGLVLLNPAMPHRAVEIAHLDAALGRQGIRPVRRVTEGKIEGGDVCVARPGLLILGLSGERTDEAGAAAFAADFHDGGWEVLTCRFDPHFLHLDTLFCMLDAHRALACTDVFDEAFLRDLAVRGIEAIPVSYKESRGLGCNILSLDGRTILMAAGHRRIADRLRESGFDPLEIDVAEFTACGGGLHCLTLPLRRVPC